MREYDRECWVFGAPRAHVQTLTVSWRISTSLTRFSSAERPLGAYTSRSCERVAYRLDVSWESTISLGETNVADQVMSAVTDQTHHASRAHWLAAVRLTGVAQHPRSPYFSHIPFHFALSISPPSAGTTEYALTMDLSSPPSLRRPHQRPTE